MTSRPVGPAKTAVRDSNLLDFELHLAFLGFADVGRIRDDEVEGCSFQAVQQVGVVEEETAFELVVARRAEFELEAGGVGFGDFERAWRDVGGVNFGVGQLFGKRQCDGAGAGADIGDLWVFQRSGERQDGFDQMFGLWARNQHGGGHDQIEPPEFLVAGDVLRGDAFGALGQRFVVPRLLFFC